MKIEILKLINENKSLIYKIAHKYSDGTNLEDLFQVGCIGIINAYKNYREGYNTKFSTYAYNYILGEITNYLRNDRIIRNSGDNAKIFKLYEKAKDYLTSLNGYSPSLKEISLFLGISEELISNAINNNINAISIDSEIKDELYLQDIIGEDNRENLDARIDINSSLNNLSEEERRLINYRYYQDYTQSETASLLGMSQVQVSRKEGKILSRMRNEMIG